MTTRSDETGSALVLTTVVLVAALFVGIVAVDLAAVARAHARATAAADAAALGAAAATDPLDPANPTRVAAELALDGRATLVRCDCTGPVVEVEVLRTVRTLALYHLGVRHVRVSASATLVQEDSADWRTS